MVRCPSVAVRLEASAGQAYIGQACIGRACKARTGCNRRVASCRAVQPLAAAGAGWKGSGDVFCVERLASGVPSIRLDPHPFVLMPNCVPAVARSKPPGSIEGNRRGAGVDCTEGPEGKITEARTECVGLGLGFDSLVLVKGWAVLPQKRRFSQCSGACGAAKARSLRAVGGETKSRGVGSSARNAGRESDGMKRFHFRLERVQTVRRVQADRERLALEALRGQLGQVRERRRMVMEQSLVDGREMAAPGAEHSSAHLWQAGQFAAFSREEAARLDDRIEALCREIEEQEDRWREAELRCRVLEKLQARSLAEWESARARESDQEAADLFLARQLRGGR